MNEIAMCNLILLAFAISVAGPNWWTQLKLSQLPTLVYRIVVHARLLILSKKIHPARPYLGLYV